MRITPRVFRLQPHALQQPADAFASRVSLQQTMHAQRLHNGIPDRLPRIERGVRILKNKLNIAAQRLQFAAGQRINTLAVKGDAAALRFHQPQQRPPGSRFTAA